MKAEARKTWLQYAATGLVVAAVVAGGVTLMVPPELKESIWFGAGLAWLLQLAAFGVLLALRDNPQLFLLGWVAGIALRFLTLGIAAFWLSRTDRLPLQPALLSLVSFAVLLLFLETLFLKRGLTRK